MNIKTRNNLNILVIYLITFSFLLVLSLIIYQLLDNSITYIEIINEDFFTILLGIPIFILSKYSLLSNLVSAFIVFGITIPIGLSFKKKKLMPYIIIYILSVALWFFIGIIAFGIRNGEE